MPPPDPKLVEQALDLLKNSPHHGVIVIAITGQDQVQCVVVSERMTDMAIDHVGRDAAKAVRNALENVAKVTRQTREN